MAKSYRTGKQSWAIRRSATASGLKTQTTSQGQIQIQTQEGTPVATVETSGKVVSASPTQTVTISDGKIGIKTKTIAERRAEGQDVPLTPQEKKLGVTTQERLAKEKAKGSLSQQEIKEWYQASHSGAIPFKVIKDESGKITGVQEPVLQQSLAFKKDKPYQLGAIIKPTEKQFSQAVQTGTYGKRYEEAPEYKPTRYETFKEKINIQTEKLTKAIEQAEKEPTKFTFGTIPAGVKRGFKAWDESFMIKPLASRGYKLAKGYKEFSQSYGARHLSEGKYVRAFAGYSQAITGEILETGFKYPTVSILTLGIGSEYKLAGKYLDTSFKWLGRTGAYSYGKSAYAGDISWTEAIAKGYTLAGLTGGTKTKDVGTLAGSYKGDILITPKGIPYTSRMVQAEQLLSGKKLLTTTGLRFGEPLIKRISTKKIGAPERLGDVGVSGYEGFFATFKTKLATVSESGGYFLERDPFYRTFSKTYKSTKSIPKSLKETGKIEIQKLLHPSKITQSEIRTVKIEKPLQQKVFKAMELEDRATLKSLGDIIYKKAYQQSLKYKEPIAVPSPKRFKGIREPELEAFILSAKPEFLKVTGKQKLGFLEYQDRKIKVEKIRYGKQPKLKGNVLTTRAKNIKFNIENIGGKEYYKTALDKTYRRLGEEYGSLRMAKGEYGLHGRRTHLEPVEQGILALAKKYPKSLGKITKREVYLVGKYHDITKLGDYSSSTELFKHAETSAKFIREGKFKEIKPSERKRVARAIELHTKLQPTLISKARYRPSDLAKALMTADREQLARFGTKLELKKTFIPQFEKKQIKGMPKFRTDRIKPIREIRIERQILKPSKIERQIVPKEYYPRGKTLEIKGYGYTPKEYLPKGYGYAKVYPTIKYPTYPKGYDLKYSGGYKAGYKQVNYGLGYGYTPKGYGKGYDYTPSGYGKGYPTTPYTPYLPVDMRIPRVPPPKIPPFKWDDGGRMRYKTFRKRPKELYYTEDFTSRIIGTDPLRLTKKQVIRLLKTKFSGLEVRRSVIIKEPRRPFMQIKTPRLAFEKPIFKITKKQIRAEKKYYKQFNPEQKISGRFNTRVLTKSLW